MAFQTDQTTKNAKYIINGFQDGIADSQELGFGVIRNTEIGLFPGQAVPGLRPLSIVQNLAAKPYTVVAATNIFTVLAANMPGDGVAISFTNSGGAIPAGIAANGTYNAGTAYVQGDTVLYNNTVYVCVFAGTGHTPSSEAYYWSVAYFYVKAIDTTTFTISRKLNGADIDVTDTGSGTNTFSTAVMGNPIYGRIYKTNALSNVYSSTVIQDDLGQIWFRDSNNIAKFTLVQGNAKGTSTIVEGSGMEIFTNKSGNAYLFACNKRYAQVMDLTSFISSGTMTWSNNLAAREFDSQSNGAIHSALLGQDNRIYFCDGRYITSFSEATTFIPTDAASYTWSTKALSLPGNSIIQCLEELGVNLLIGDKASNYIYQWDRTSTNFSIPIRCSEDNIWKMININNTVYILAGQKGIVYSTQGYTCDVFRKLPEYVTGGQVTWGGIEKVNGHLLFGCLGYKAETGVFVNGGVYKIFLHTLKPGTIVIDQTPVTGTETVVPTLILSNDADSYFYGTYESSKGQIDYVNPDQFDALNNKASGRYQNYEAVIESPLFAVSPVQEYRNFELTGIELGRKLAGTEGIKISYRENISDAYTDLTTFDYATYGDIVNEYANSSIAEVQSLQIKIALKTSDITQSTVGNQSPRLKTVYIK